MAVSRIDEAGLNINQYGNRNLIINGAFQCWQRGTSSTTHGYGSADRWFHYTNSTGFTFAQTTDAPDGFTYAITTTGTPAGEFNIGQGIELPAANEAGVFTNGQTITVSYYAKSSTAGDRLWNALFFRTAVQSSSGQVSIDFDNTDNNLLSTSWQRFSKTYTIGVVPANNCNQLAIQIRSRNNANDSSTPAGNISVTGVQIEVGDTATDFEHRTFGDELQRCQRYFQKIIASSSETSLNLGTGQAFSGTQGYIFNELPVTMRAKPSLSNSISALGNLGSMNATGGGVGISGLAILTAWSNADRVTINMTVASGTFTAGQVTELNAGGVNGAFIAYDAEL